VLGIDAQEGLFLAEQSFLHHLHGGAHHGLSIHLAVAGLKTIEHTLSMVNSKS